MRDAERDEAKASPWQTFSYAGGRDYFHQPQPSLHPHATQHQVQQENIPFAAPSQARPLAGYANSTAAWLQTYPRTWDDTPFVNATQPPVLYSVPKKPLGRELPAREPCAFLNGDGLSDSRPHVAAPRQQAQSQAQTADPIWPSRLFHLDTPTSLGNRREENWSNLPAPQPRATPTPWQFPLQDMHDLHNRAGFGQNQAQRDYARQAAALTQQLEDSDLLLPKRETSQSLGLGGTFSTFGSFTYPARVAQPGVPLSAPVLVPTSGERTSPTVGSRRPVQRQHQQERQAHVEDKTRGRSPSDTSAGDAVSIAASTEAQTEVSTEASSVATAESVAALPWPSAPGFRAPLTGYEFELHHDVNLRELHYQKQWARVQLSSCNENARFHHTQTTGCIVAVNGRIIGPYSPDSLRCYGTNPEVAGLRVTMTVHEGVGGSGSGNSNAETANGATTVPALFDEPMLVLRHQIVVPPRRNAGGGAGQGHHRGMSSLRPPVATPDHGGSGGVPGSGHQQGRRRHFATTLIPLRGGVAARPGYRPLEATEAVERIRTWGGQPSRGVFGNAWMVRLAVEPGHVQHLVDERAMELLGGRGVGDRGGCWFAGGQASVTGAQASVLECMLAVNQSMATLGQRDGTLSIMLSNHATQKRMARQCPDLVAMWVGAQANL